MNQALVDQIAQAVLYEGYILYPYRPSVKNRQRWTFGGLYPESYSQAQGGSDASAMRTECLVQGDANTTLTVSVRFLHLVARLVGELARPLPEWPADAPPPCRFVEALRVGDKVFSAWQEVVERKIDLDEANLGEIVTRAAAKAFDFPSLSEQEPLRDGDGAVVGVIVRERRQIVGSVRLSAEEVGEKVFRISVSIQNRTPLADAASASRDEALLHGLVSTHTVLGIQGGEFVSLIDPPEPLRALTAECRNVGTWPILVGAEGERDTMLSAPIILYDYPQIAPESPGDLFDSTEIDEILTLRIMTLTEEEKRDMACVDERARAVLQRTEALEREQLLGLHGTFRGLRPLTGGRDDG